MDIIPEGQPPLLKEKQDAVPMSSKINIVTVSEKVLDSEVADDSGGTDVLRDERDIATHVISVEDDTSLSPWTYRAFIIGSGLSVFASALGEYSAAVGLDCVAQLALTAEIYYFKPVRDYPL
jgi:hypothetical protein